MYDLDIEFTWWILRVTGIKFVNIIISSCYFLIRGMQSKSFGIVFQVLMFNEMMSLIGH